MAQRLRSGNAQNRPPNIPPPFPDLDSRSNPDSQFLSTTHIPEELWMGGPPRRPADYPPSVAALWERPTQSDTAPARVISETEQQEDETLLSVATFPLPQSESGSDGDEGIEMPTSSVSVPPTPPSSAGAIDAGHVYSGTIPFLEEAESQQDSPPIIEINQGRYRSYRDFAKTNQILHDLPEEEKRTYLCVFCKGNDEPPAVYKSHPIRINGIVACPHLRAHGKILATFLSVTLTSKAQFISIFWFQCVNFARPQGMKRIQSNTALRTSVDSLPLRLETRSNKSVQ